MPLSPVSPLSSKGKGNDMKNLEQFKTDFEKWFSGFAMASKLMGEPTCFTCGMSMEAALATRQLIREAEAGKALREAIGKIGNLKVRTIVEDGKGGICPIDRRMNEQVPEYDLALSAYDSAVTGKRNEE